MRLTPRASENRIGPVATDSGGGAVLKVAVTAPPEGGKANKALIKLLAKAWRLPKTTISVKKGAKNRMKTLFIEGPGLEYARGLPPELLKRLEENS